MLSSPVTILRYASAYYETSRAEDTVVRLPSIASWRLLCRLHRCEEAQNFDIVIFPSNAPGLILVRDTATYLVIRWSGVPSAADAGDCSGGVDDLHRHSVTVATGAPKASDCWNANSQHRTDLHDRRIATTLANTGLVIELEKSLVCIYGMMSNWSC